MAAKITAIPTRLPDWRPRLEAYLSRSAAQPGVVGEMDCALFAAGAIEAMTGVDPAARWRGKYSTIARGMAALRRSGFADHVDMACRLLDEVSPAMAQIGDLAVIDTPDGPALGVVGGAHVLVRREDNLASVDLLQAKRAFALQQPGGAA